jgi:hypothetical protein
MRTIRVMLVGLLGALAVLSLAAAPKEPKKTYSVVGYFSGGKPSPALLEKASRAIGEKMAGFTQVTDPNEATHRIEILFRRDSFEIYMDALPLERRPPAAIEKQSLITWSEKSDQLVEAMQGH